MNFVTNEVPGERTCYVFLDLEETVIDDWQNMNLLLSNIDKIEKRLNGHTVSVPPPKGKTGDVIISQWPPIVNLRLGLMSWAVWDEDDKASFNKNLRPHLENLLRRPFDDELVLSMDDWASQFKHRKKMITREDLFDIFSKPDVLFMLMNTHPWFKDSIVFLIDDAYEHQMSGRSFAHNCMLEIQNINKL